MNIMILDYDIVKCAEYHNDTHTYSQLKEAAQMLSTACRSTGLDVGNKSTHINHPCNIWLRESQANWLWLRNLAEELQMQWRLRFGHPKWHTHKSWRTIKALPVPTLPTKGLTPFAQAVGSYKKQDAVEAYRNYYIGEKQHLAKWTNVSTPYWWQEAQAA